jgi:hypothetical protein
MQVRHSIWPNQISRFVLHFSWFVEKEVFMKIVEVNEVYGLEVNQDNLITASGSSSSSSCSCGSGGSSSSSSSSSCCR